VLCLATGLLTPPGHRDDRFAQDDVQVTFEVSSAYSAALSYLQGQLDFPVSEDAQDSATLGAALLL
jgi:hypothetical protein